MNLLDRLERKIGWIAIPGIVRIIMCMQLLVFVLGLLQMPSGVEINAGASPVPPLAEALILSGEKILDGEVWRLVSFIFLPPTRTGFIIMLFAFIFTMFLGNMLENIWGSFRLTIYVLGGILCMVISEVIFPTHVPIIYTKDIGFGGYLVLGGGGHLLFMASLLFACAVYNPHFKVMLFGIIPVKLFWLALFDAGIIVLEMFSQPFVLGLAIVVALGNFLIVFVPGLKAAVQMRAEVSARRRKFEEARAPAMEAMHLCASCGKTEQDDGELVFRVADDGEEYCVDCREKQRLSDS
ncbi:MAG: rhomboid family intramembrane serine protease [Verrucomicrobiaceae bacterium]|nr:rhomboid family intramembrane serine protease [Verrucomicrobiaceae bacterium]